jgi:hypothetical protein
MQRTRSHRKINLKNRTHTNNNYSYELLQSSSSSQTTSMYGLTIYKHHHEHVRYSNEKSLVHECCQLVTETLMVIDSEINDEVQPISANALSRALLSTISELETELDRLKELWFTFQSKEDDTDLMGYNFQCRGVLLTVLHVMNSIYCLYLKKRERKNSNVVFKGIHYLLDTSGKTIQQMIRKLNVLKVLVEMCCLLQEDRNDRRNNDSSVMKRGYDFPFSDSQNIDDYEQVTSMNTADFYSNIGTCYVPWLQFSFKMIVKLTASHGKSCKLSEVDLLQKFGLAVHNVYYLLNHDHAAHACVEFFKEVNSHSASKMWDLYDHTLISPFMYMHFPHVYASRAFTIPMKIPVIPPCAVKANVTQHQIEAVACPDHVGTDDIILIEETLPSVTLEPSLDKDNSLPHEANISLDQFIIDTNAIPQMLKEMGYCHKDVTVRLILPSVEHDKVTIKKSDDYPVLYKINQLRNNTVDCCLAPQIHDNDNDGTVMLHIHGGGFIAMSSFGHEGYLRVWAQQMQIPIISIDYRKAPDYTCPVQAEECYTVYKWIIENAQNEILGGVPLKKIIVCGDSAGGNLTLNVTQRAIHDGIRIPDGLAISYPATYVCNSPSPARLMALIDPLVAMNFLVCTS